MTAGDATKPQIASRGIAALLGVLAALCTIFVLAVTAAEAWQERVEAQWPETTARVDRCYLHQTSTGRRNRYYIDCHLSYRVGSEQIAAHVYSANVPSREVPQYPPNQIAPLEEWVERHPPDTEMTVRYDPSRHSRIILVATDMPRAGGPHTTNNLKLLGVFATSSVLLLGLARI